MRSSLAPTLLSASLLATLTACSPPKAAPTAQPPEVLTLTTTTSAVPLTTELPGRTVAYRIAEIRPQVNGLILKRLFEEGSDVQAGQPLYDIDPAPFQAALDNAEAALARAQALHPALVSRAERFRLAQADKAVSRQDLEDAEAALQQNLADIASWKAGVEAARIQRAYARIVSPIPGRIGRSSITDGAIVTAYQPVALATVQQLDPIYVDVPQSSTERLRLRQRLEAGQLRHDTTAHNRVSLILPDGSPYPHPGSLQFRDVSVEPSTDSVTLRMVFPNPDGVLLPGMFVRTVIEEGTNDRAILIPQQAVARDPKGNPWTLVVDDSGHAVQRRLDLDRAVGDRWLVRSGLQPGDRIVVEGLQRAKPGAAVREVHAQDPAPPHGPGLGSGSETGSESNSPPSIPTPSSHQQVAGTGTRTGTGTARR
jgi:membrane fusion protein (multidrug efflux system)